MDHVNFIKLETATDFLNFVFVLQGKVSLFQDSSRWMEGEC